jgi:hypothetical protein
MSGRWIGLSIWLVFAPTVFAQTLVEGLPPGASARLGEVRYRNVGRVFSVAFSPDGKTLAAGAWDGSIRLWDVATGKELRQYTGHSGWVRSVVFSPVGKILASGGKDKILHLWDPSTGNELRQLKGHQNWIQYLAFSPDGKILGSRGAGQTLRLWDVASGRELRQFELAKWSTRPFAFSPDSKLLAYPGEYRSILLVDAASGKEVRRISVPERTWLDNITFSPDGKILAAANNAWPYTIHLWESATGKALPPIAKLEVEVGSLVLSPNGRSLAVAGGDHVLQVWEVLTHHEQCRFHSPDKKSSALAYSPDGRLLAQGSDDTSVLLWDLTGRLEKGHLRPATLSTQELQSLWADLAGADASKAYRAIWILAAAAPQSLPFLKEHLRPVSPVEARTVSRWVADLDHEQFAKRQHATEQLEKIGELAEPSLRQVLQTKPPLETRQRIERLLEKAAAEWANPSAERLRVLRALEALEQMETPAARQWLEDLARGAPGAEITKQAKAALGRMSKR